MGEKKHNKAKNTCSITVQERVKNMQLYYAQTGSYRTDDLDHVLGDLKRSIVLAVPAYNSFSARKDK